MKTKTEIYTEEFVKIELNKILNEVLNNKEILYIGEIFESLPYSRQRYSEWANKFKRIVTGKQIGRAHV